MDATWENVCLRMLMNKLERSRSSREQFSPKATEREVQVEMFNGLPVEHGVVCGNEKRKKKGEQTWQVQRLDCRISFKEVKAVRISDKIRVICGHKMIKENKCRKG